MLSLTTTEQTAVSAQAVGVVWLVELDFTDATHRFTSFNLPINYGGNTYAAVGNLLSVGEVKESQDPSTSPISLRLSVANSALLASALGSVEKYRGRAARLYLGLLDEQWQLIGPPRLRLTGHMEPVKIDRDSPGPEGGPVGGVIELPISRTGMARARNAEGTRLTYPQAWAENPGDKGLEYLQGLIAKPVPWLTKRFQERD